MCLHLKKHLKWPLVVKVLLLSTISLVSFNWITDSNDEKFKHAFYQPESHFKPLGDSGKVHFVTIGPESKKHNILFVHGSPGSWEAFSNQLSDTLLQKHFFMISVDRPGYGKTSLPPMQSLKKQAEAVATVFSAYPNKSFILVGHSYGGAVIEQLALDYRDKVDYLMYLAPTLSPAYQHPKWYNRWGRRKAFNWLLSKGMKASNHEMLGLEKSLKQNEDRLRKITIPTTYIQGKKDWLVPYETIAYYKSHIGLEFHEVLLEDANHFLPWTQEQLIHNELFSIINQEFENLEE